MFAMAKLMETEMILVKEIDKNNKSFEDIKHIDENGVESSKEFNQKRKLLT